MVVFKIAFDQGLQLQKCLRDLHAYGLDLLKCAAFGVFRCLIFILVGFRCLNKGQGLACLWAFGPVFSFQKDIIHVSKKCFPGW